MRVSNRQVEREEERKRGEEAERRRERERLPHSLPWKSTSEKSRRTKSNSLVSSALFSRLEVQELTFDTQEPLTGAEVTEEEAEARGAAPEVEESSSPKILALASLYLCSLVRLEVEDWRPMEVEEEEGEREVGFVGTFSRRFNKEKVFLPSEKLSVVEEVPRRGRGGSKVSRFTRLNSSGDLLML